MLCSVVLFSLIFKHKNSNFLRWHFSSDFSCRLGHERCQELTPGTGLLYTITRAGTAQTHGPPKPKLWQYCVLYLYLYLGLITILSSHPDCLAREQTHVLVLLLPAPLNHQLPEEDHHVPDVPIVHLLSTVLYCILYTIYYLQPCVYYLSLGVYSPSVADLSRHGTQPTAKTLH